MAKYLIAIHGNEQRWGSMTAAEWDAIDAGHRKFHERAGGTILSEGQLEDRTKWSTVRVGDDGEPTAVDGPFAETKEMLGGFYVIDVADKDIALDLARLLAEARTDHSGVEVIPLMVH